MVFSLSKLTELILWIQVRNPLGFTRPGFLTSSAVAAGLLYYTVKRVAPHLLDNKFLRKRLIQLTGIDDTRKPRDFVDDEESSYERYKTDSEIHDLNAFLRVEKSLRRVQYAYEETKDRIHQLNEKLDRRERILRDMTQESLKEYYEKAQTPKDQQVPLEQFKLNTIGELRKKIGNNEEALLKLEKARSKLLDKGQLDDVPKALRNIYKRKAPKREERRFEEQTKTYKFRRVGITNQGATCYLNSLLQALFHLQDFKRKIYDMETKSEDDDSVSVSMQRMFYLLQRPFSDVDPEEDWVEPASTRLLTKSFGWDTAQVYQQNDVQELMKVLFSALEDKLDHGLVELFEGRMKRQIKCLNVPFESSGEEPFSDLILNVVGYTDLYQSLENLVQKTALINENKYDTGDEKYGKQDAYMQRLISALPNVLVMHLNRFSYTGAKANDRLRFFSEIDMSDYVVPELRNKNNEYVLYGVLTHRGTVQSGHYMAYLKPSLSSSWYVFNDDDVTAVTAADAIDGNFGGFGQTAYMLIYIKKTEYSRIMRPVYDEDIPKHLMQRFKEEAEGGCSIM